MQDCDNGVIADQFATLVARSPFAQKKAQQWSSSRNEWTGAAGWGIFARLVYERALPDSWFEPLLLTIEERIHSAQNRTRYSMLTALIAIGLRPALTQKAIAAAKRIGKVDIAHGETGCKTPDPVTYIPKAAARFAARTRNK